MTTLAPCTPQPTASGQMEIESFVDSHAPIDFDPERGDGWPLPEPRKFAPSGEANLWQRIRGWFGRMA